MRCSVAAAAAAVVIVVAAAAAAEAVAAPTEEQDDQNDDPNAVVAGIAEHSVIPSSAVVIHAAPPRGSNGVFSSAAGNGFCSVQAIVCLPLRIGSHMAISQRRYSMNNPFEDQFELYNTDVPPQEPGTEPAAHPTGEASGRGAAKNRVDRLLLDESGEEAANYTGDEESYRFSASFFFA